MWQNKLKLNEDKTKLIVITPTRQSHKVTVHSTRIGNCTESLPTAKNLGAIFDDSMNLNEHVTTLVRSCNFKLRYIRQARTYLIRDVTEKVLHVFLSSRLGSDNALLYGLPDYQIQHSMCRTPLPGYSPELKKCEISHLSSDLSTGFPSKREQISKCIPWPTFLK